MLHLHAATRIEPLAARLAEVLSSPPADPFAPEWIAVPSEGMRRWLHLELSAHLGSAPGRSDGVAANIVSAFPASLRLEVLDAATGSSEDPWRVEHLVWSVLGELAGLHDDAALRTVATVPDGSSLYGRARRIADLFDGYHVHRTDMVLRWTEGDDVDGSGRPLPDHHRWQPRLWRRVRARVGAPSPPERLPELLAALHRPDEPLDVPGLPERLAMFGLSVLPGGAGFLDLADAVGASRDLHVFMVEPSPAASRRVVERLEEPSGRARLRSDDVTADEVRHPLLRSWGRLHRETTVLLADGEREGVRPVERLDDGPAVRPEPESLLGHLQRDLRLDRSPAADLLPRPDDRSIQLHATHGVARQVEVLRDVLLHLLADESLGLDEDDILVVCPRLEPLAATVAAVLGPSADHDGPGPRDAPSLRYRLADRSLRRAVPLLEALDSLLEVAAGRFDAPGVLDLISLVPVRVRFGFSDDDVARIGEWTVQGRVRWGLDEHQRDAVGLPAEFRTNTWRAALDRLLLGLAVHDDHHLAVGDVVPIPLTGDDAQLAGRFAELVWRLDQLAEQSRSSRPLREWIELIRVVASQLLDVERSDSWQTDVLDGVLADVVDDAAPTGGTEVALDFVDLRRLLSERLEAVPGRADFYRGGITISSMTPLRGVPFRAVVVLGADQPAFHVGAPDGDDLCAATPLLGDRDRRGESRQALLEAVLSARDRLVVIREGHDVRTNQATPRAVPIAELVDAVLAMVDPAERDAVATRLEVDHPRQPFDEAAFRPGVLAPRRPWSFDHGARRGAIARRERSELQGELLSAPLEPIDEPVLELADLHRFLSEPVAHFVQRRLGVRLPGRDEAPPSLVPLNLVGLDRWEVGDRLLRWILDGGDVVEWERVERRLGTLGPGSLGDRSVEEVRSVVDALVLAADAAGVERGPPRPVPVDVQLPDGTRIVGQLEDRLAGRPGTVRTTYSSFRPGYLVAAWLDLVALVASDSTVPWRSVGVHKDPAKPDAVVLDLDLRAAEDDPTSRRDVAVEALAVAVDCYRRGSSEPIPLFPLVSHDLWSGGSGTSSWVRHQGGGDGTSASTRLVWGDRDIRDLRRQTRRPHDPLTRSGEHADRPTCFAEHLWSAVDRSVVQRAVEPAAETADAGGPT